LRGPTPYANAFSATGKANEFPGVKKGFSLTPNLDSKSTALSTELRAHLA
jgi:hypothetical protein